MSFDTEMDMLTEQDVEHYLEGLGLSDLQKVKAKVDNLVKGAASSVRYSAGDRVRINDLYGCVAIGKILERKGSNFSVEVLQLLGASRSRRVFVGSKWRIPPTMMVLEKS